MATFRIGADDLFTGADLAADAKTLDGMVDALSKSFGEAGASTRAGRDLADTWISFYLDWKEYYASDWASPWHSDLLTALNDANRDHLIQWETRFADIVAKLDSKGVSSAYVNVQLSAGAPDTVKRLFESVYSVAKSIGGIGTGLIILVVVGLLVWTFVIPMISTTRAVTQ